MIIKLRQALEFPHFYTFQAFDDSNKYIGNISREIGADSVGLSPMFCEATGIPRPGNMRVAKDTLRAQLFIQGHVLDTPESFE